MTAQTISDQTWAAIRTEFTLPTLAQVHRRLSELMEDPEPLMRQLVRVFLSGLWRMGNAKALGFKAIHAIHAPRQPASFTR